MKAHLRVLLLILIVANSPLLREPATAGEGDQRMQNAKLSITNLALFKNGTGFVVSKARLPERATTVRLGQLPVPSFGTFWVGYGKELKVRSLVASMEQVREKVPLQSVDQLLELSAGRKVVLHWGSELMEGTLLPRVTAEKRDESRSPYLMGGEANRVDAGARTERAGMFLLKTDKGTVALNSGSISRADFTDGGDVADSTWFTRRRPSIRLELDEPSGGEEIAVSYLARGVTWTPGYLIDLSEPDKAKVSAHALVINELADFSNVRLELVTGFPNMQFSDLASPIAMSQSLAEFLNDLSRGTGGSREGWSGNRVMQQQAVMVNAPVMERENPALVAGYSTAAEGQVAEDLFFYPVKGFSLKRNETAWLPLFSAEMPYKHVYVWKIADFVDNQEYYRPEAEVPGGKKAEEVWHCCRLTNNLNMPLTTAATEFTTGGELTGQDICYYTAPGAETTIRINRAMSVLAEQEEVEVERKMSAARYHGYDYDLVKVRGELHVRNRMKKDVTMEITKQASGQILETSPAARDVPTAKGLKQVNPAHVLTWGIDLKAGAEKKVEYVYQVYIRR